jgi:hypothetical protein
MRDSIGTRGTQLLVSQAATRRLYGRQSALGIPASRNCGPSGKTERLSVGTTGGGPLCPRRQKVPCGTKGAPSYGPGMLRAIFATFVEAGWVGGCPAIVLSIARDLRIGAAGKCCRTARLLRVDPAHRFVENEQVHGAGRGGGEIEMFVEAPRFLVFCMNARARIPAMSAAWSVRCIASLSTALPTPLPCHR